MEIDPASKSIPYHGNIRPPYSTYISFVENARFGSKLKKIMIGLIGALIIAGILAAIGHAMQWTWLLYTGAGLGLLIAGINIYEAIGSQRAPCPYCGDELGKTSSVIISKTDEHRQFECPRCFEWIISENGQLRAFREADIREEKEFRTPLFKNGSWPAECIVCGNPVTHYAEAKNTTMSMGALLVGRISVAWGSVKNVPYCSEHNDAVKLKIDKPDMFLVFPDYASRRRYLAVNPVRVPAKV